jgi:hypothetical protein
MVQRSTRPDVMKMLGRGMLLAGAGMAAGLAASFALTRVMSKLLYGVSPRDPMYRKELHQKKLFVFGTIGNFVARRSFNRR